MTKQEFKYDLTRSQQGLNQEKELSKCRTNQVYGETKARVNQD